MENSFTQENRIGVLWYSNSLCIYHIEQKPDHHVVQKLRAYSQLYRKNLMERQPWSRKLLSHCTCQFRRPTEELGGLSLTIMYVLAINKMVRSSKNNRKNT
jgi:hypothetical protein